VNGCERPLKEEEYDLRLGLEQLVSRIAAELGQGDFSPVVLLNGELPTVVRSEPLLWTRCLREIEKGVRAGGPGGVTISVDKRAEEAGEECLCFTIRSRRPDREEGVRKIMLPTRHGSRTLGKNRYRGESMVPISVETVEPVVDNHPGCVQGFKSARLHTVGNAGIRVLLAEDNAPNRFVARTFLEKNGYTVYCVENGAEVLELLNQQEVDVILMDIQMPVMDGLEATRLIRQGQGMDRSIPIIALTAYAMRGDRERFLEHGMNDYLSKPVHFKTLFDRIEQLVKEYRGPRRPEENH
jgi:CheY-like chemotaxis protein